MEEPNTYTNTTTDDNTSAEDLATVQDVNTPISGNDIPAVSSPAVDLVQSDTPSSSKRHILLVEDDAFVRDLYIDVLSSAGYEVTYAIDGENALEVSRQGRYDLVLLDIMLPKLTGLEVLKAFKEPDSAVKDVPVYLLTNLGEENISEEAYRLGADGYLLKAKYLPKQLVEEIDKFFVKRQGPGISISA